MASPEVIAIRQDVALNQIRQVIEKHDPEAAERLSLLTYGGTTPHTIKMPHEFSAYLAECVAVLATVVDRQVAPKKRGRPRKSEAA